jgi:hypothetical protein
LVVDKINLYLSTDGKDIDQAILDESAKLCASTLQRQFGVKKESERSLRLSAIGKCVRQQAYNILNYEYKGKEVDSRSKMVFFQGDMAELAIVQLAKIAGCDIKSCGTDQGLIFLDGTPGHPDGILGHEMRNYLLEIKSMSSYSFSDFQKGILDEGYIWQINSYLEATGLLWCVVVALNKDSGVLAERVIEKDMDIVKKIKARISLLNGLNSNDLPERPHSANDKGILPWQCLYCPFWGICWPDAERVLMGKAYKLKINVKNEKVKGE